MKIPSISIYRSNSLNPFINLAIENYLFVNHEKQPHHQILYLWRNGPSVIIGRYQSAYKECNNQQMEHEKVYLVRRASGGGAVYQDAGNSIFSFITPKQPHNQDQITKNNHIIMNALSSIGVNNLEASGRNDLLCQGRKISGAAFKHTKQSSLHHGTLLLDVDMTALGRYLTPNKAKLASKGVSSVESRVLNLKEVHPTINHDMMNDALVQSFFQTHDTSCDIIDMDESIVNQEPLIRAKVDELQDWNWRYGQEPQFTYHIETRMAWATLDVHLLVNRSIIDDIVIHTDALDVKLIESFRHVLIGCVYTADMIRQRLASIREDQHEHSREHLDQFQEWLIGSMI